MDVHEYFLFNCSLMNDTKHIWWLVKMGSGNDMVQTITRANANPDLYLYMNSLGHNELIIVIKHS